MQGLRYTSRGLRRRNNTDKWEVTLSHVDPVTGEIDTSGDYAMIKLIDTYNQAAEPFGYTMPGPDTTITITFTVSGLTD